jgi:hypothetical protein
MKDNATRWLFVLLIPFLLAIGHDVYANYWLDEERKAKLEAFDIDPTAYQSSDIGYLLTEYTPDIYVTAKDMVPEESWQKWVDPVLRQYTFVLAGIPAVLFSLWLLIARIFDSGPFSGGTSSRKENKNAPPSASLKKSGDAMKFKRR